jgi:hypothetical protein
MQPHILALHVQWQRASYCRTQPSRHLTILSLKTRKDPVPDIGVFFFKETQVSVQNSSEIKKSVFYNDAGIGGD